jgi:hypothetical protein
MAKAKKSVGPTVKVEVPTVETIKGKRDRAEVARLLSERIELKTVRDAADARIKEVNEELEPLFITYDIKALQHDGKVICMVVSSGRSNMNKQRLLEGLIKRNVDIDVIDKAMAEATSMSAGYTTFQVKDAGGADSGEE